jgi:hypothetical protein
MKNVTQKVIGKFPGARCKWDDAVGGHKKFTIRSSDGKWIGFGETKEAAWEDAYESHVKPKEK